MHLWILFLGFAGIFLPQACPVSSGQVMFEEAGTSSLVGKDDESIYSSARLSFERLDSWRKVDEPETISAIKNLIELEPRLARLFSEDPEPEQFNSAIATTELLRSSISKYLPSSDDPPEIDAAKRLALSLISAALVSASKCKLTYLVQFHIWLTRNARLPALIDYLKRNMMRQLDVCAEAINDQVGADSPSLEPQLDTLANELQLFEASNPAEVPMDKLEQSLANLVSCLLSGAASKTLANLNEYKLNLILAIQIAYAHECSHLANKHRAAIDAYQLLTWFAGTSGRITLRPAVWRVISKATLCKRLEVSQLGPSSVRSYGHYKAQRRSTFACLKPRILA